MLLKEFDYTIAHYQQGAEILASEVEVADFITIEGLYPGGIYHSTYCRWQNIYTLDQPVEYNLRSPKIINTIEKNKRWFEKNGYSIRISQMTESDFHQYEKIYEELTLKKARATNYNLYERILGRIKIGTPVYCAGLYEGSQLVSASLFVMDNDQVSIHFSSRIHFPKITGGVGSVLQWEIIKFSIEKGCTSLDQGKSRNPSGFVTKAGLFEFKARHGSTAYPEGPWITTFVKNPSKLLSDLVFVTVLNNEIGYLVVSDKPIDEIKDKYITRRINNIDIRNFAWLATQTDQFISNISSTYL